MNLIPTSIMAPRAGERRITGIEVTDPVPFKTVGNSGRKGFGLRALYVIEGGEKTTTVVFSERKKDLPARLEREQKNIAAGCLSLDNGFVVSRFTIG